MPRIKMTKTCKTCNYGHDEWGKMVKCDLIKILPKKDIVCIDYNQWKMYSRKKINNCVTCFHRDFDHENCRICDNKYNNWKRRR